jgi:hypothetical protein
MIKCNLIDVSSGKYLKSFLTPKNNLVLGTATEGNSHGIFKTATRSTAGTTTICSPAGDGSIVLTDLIASGQKKAGTLIVQFYDGTNTEIVCTFYLTDAPLAFAIPFNGRWQGWQSAYLDMVTDIVADVTVTVGYYKVSKENSLKYDEWNDLR